MTTTARSKGARWKKPPSPFLVSPMEDGDDHDGEIQRRALEKAFGESSDDGDDEFDSSSSPFLVSPVEDGDDHDGEIQRRALEKAFGESSDDGDDEFDSSSSPFLVSPMEDGDDHDSEMQRRALEKAFGESSDDGDDEFDSFSSPFLEEEGDDRPLTWEMVDAVNGLWLCRGFLCSAKQLSLLSAIRREGWFDDGCHNQAMRFGNLPGWAEELSQLVREAVCNGDVSLTSGKGLRLGDQYEEDCWPLRQDILWREPLFDQLIANVYNPGEGICAHVDLMRFDDGIAIISLESECVMHFTRSKKEESNNEVQGEEDFKRVPVFLNPGSLVVMSGEARYLWKHEINRKQGFQFWEGKEIHQQRRTSVTLRKLCKSPN